MRQVVVLLNKVKPMNKGGGPRQVCLLRNLIYLENAGYYVRVVVCQRPKLQFTLKGSDSNYTFLSLVYI